ncbi:MAG TPA: HD domain-containing protein [Candidatus Acidoferrales bacterium]|nr:HD domain-containing protein [Candidatus Acidoferrales bacterium]
MKSPFVSELASDQSIVTYFVVCGKEICSSAKGRKWLQLELGDKTGVIYGKMWDGFEGVAASVAPDDVVKIQARSKTYNGKLELTVEKIRRAEPEEYDLEDLIPHTEKSIGELKKKLAEYVRSVRNPWISGLLDEVLDDPRVAGRFERAPAAKVMHHAYVGGLLEHVVSLCGLCRLMEGHYPELDGDLLVAAAVLHDIGKLDEMSYERAVQYTPEGELLGHILIGYELVGRKMDAIPGFPAELRTLILHIIASHHGQYEFGSPKLPMFREALVFHYLDELDSRVGAMRRGLEAPAAEGGEIWTGRVAALGRRLLRTDRFAAGSTGAAAGELAETADVAGGRETRGAPRAASPAKGDGK